MIRSYYKLIMSNVLNPIRVDAQSLIRPQFMIPCSNVPNIEQIRTFKEKSVLKLRCKSCYFKCEDDIWYVYCREHPKHKQRQKFSWQEKKDKMIVTHVTRTGSYLKKHYQYLNHDL